jgi:UDP-glucose 4-epimerase
VVSAVPELGSIAGRRVLVTGASGFIGRPLVERLVAREAEVCILLRDQVDALEQLPSSLVRLRPQLSFVYADLRNRAMTFRAVRDAAPQQVIHLAAAGVTNPSLSVDLALRHNLYGTVNLTEACFDNHTLPQPVERLLVARTPAERYPASAYGASKRAAWAFCEMFSQQANWPILGAMIFQAYGPGQPDQALVPAAVRAALDGAVLPMTNGLQARDWIFVDDVVSGLAACLQAPLSPGVTVELGTGVATKVRDVAGRIFELADSPSRPAPGLLPERPGESGRQVADPEIARALLGWQPQTTLDQGLQRTIAWYSAEADA